MILSKLRMGKINSNSEFAEDFENYLKNQLEFAKYVKVHCDDKNYSLDIKGCALCHGNEILRKEGESIEKLVSSIKTKTPAFSKVEDVQAKYERYAGEFLEFERRGEDVPKKATLDDLLIVMKSFDNKAEKMVGVLGGMVGVLGGIEDNTEKMLEKQDITIDILKSVKEDTAQIRQDTAQIRQDITQIWQDTARIPGIVENTGKILEHISCIPGMKEDTVSIRYDTKEIATKLWEKYEELSKEIARMKITLAKIETKVFG